MTIVSQQQRRCVQAVIDSALQVLHPMAQMGMAGYHPMYMPQPYFAPPGMSPPGMPPMPVRFRASALGMALPAAAAV